MTRVAVLPMYDWPGVAAATDRLWACLRDALRAEGVAAPEGLTRDPDYARHWLDPGLVLGQTCGLPFVQRLEGRVTLLGAPDYGQEGCPPGWYRSLIVAAAGDRREGLGAFRGARVAVNSRGSQSGYAALMHSLAGIAEGTFFGSVLETGSHAASAAALVAGRADLAALDSVSWGFIRAFVPGAGDLRVVAETEPTPGLPYIAAAGTDPGPHRRAVAAGIAALDAGARADLSLRGFVAFEPADYARLRTRLAAAEARLRLAPGW